MMSSASMKLGDSGGGLGGQVMALTIQTLIDINTISRILGLGIPSVLV